MIVTPTSGALKKFRRTPWRFQQTIERGRPDGIDQLLSLIIRSHQDISGGTVTIDEIVFDTERLGSVCPAHTTIAHDCSVTAQSPEELHTLLAAALWDGPDFLCVPSPKPFVFYADHHDRITFYANTKSHLNHVIEPLASHGYKLINWQRERSQ